MHPPWRTFAALIHRSLSGKTTSLDKLRLFRAQILWDKTLSWRSKIGMYTSMDDYLINTLRFVSAKEETQIYGAILPESLINPEMKETKAYKTYLASTEEPTGKSKRVKIPAKKNTKAPARGIVIRETPEIPVSKKKKRWMLLEGNDEDDSNNKQESSGEDSDEKNDSDDDKTQSDNENELGSEHETNENESGSESNQEVNEEDEDDEEEVKEELVKTLSNNSDDKDETKITDKVEGDEDEEMDYTTRQLYDDVDIRLNEPVDTDKEFVQEEGFEAAMT
ncbi:hypothetical protein Tco_1322763, partial [Tanacetum coccineum]